MVNRTESRFPEFEASKKPLQVLCDDLLASQKQSWPRLRDGYASLGKIQTRVIHCKGFDATLQFNAGRIVSTAAVVDAESIRKRPCFLCRENLPPEQEGILVDGKFLVLCNPAPIFQKHFTISHIEHKPQSIEDSIPQFLNLARLLQPAYTVFYNGPKCGASAPDHLHFQASPSGAIPIEREAGMQARIGRGGQIRALKNLGRGVLCIEGKEPADLEHLLGHVLRTLRATFSVHEEPMVNILASPAGDRLRLFVFPRSKHRPAEYFAEGEAKVTVSPAAVDMGGLIITPVEKDFRRLNAAMVESIYEEVSVSEQTIDKLIKEIA